jgi:hypothetical protein
LNLSCAKSLIICLGFYRTILWYAVGSLESLWLLNTLGLTNVCTVMSAEFNFKLWLEIIDLNADSIEKIHRAKITDVVALCLLSPYDVTALKLDIGDRGKFQQALKKLRLQYPDEDEDLNASNSGGSGVDDTFDGTDPEQVVIQ